MNPNSNNWYYRLGTDNDDTFLWTGHISSNTRITRTQARHFIRQKERLNRLPARTIVMSSRELCQSRGYDSETSEAIKLIGKYC